MSNHHESITPLIKLCRKFDACNQQQLTECINKLPVIFGQYNSFNLLIKIFLKGICSYHNQITTDLFNKIESILPSEKLLKIDDTITKSCVNDEKASDLDDVNNSEPISLLQIPKDIKIYFCNFLKEKDLYELQKVCRSLNIVSRDQNSLYHLSLYQYHNYYLNDYYSRIKSLHFSIEYDSDNEYESSDDEYEYENNNNLKYNFNKKWGTNVIISPALFYHPNMPYFNKLQQCVLRDHRVLTENKINPINIKILELVDIVLISQSILKLLMKFINLEQLSMREINTMNHNIDIDINHKLYTLTKLRSFRIDESMNQLPNFTHWVLNNSNKIPKKFIFFCNKPIINPICLFSNNSDVVISALKTIKQFQIFRTPINGLDLLLKNIKNLLALTKHRLDNFDIHFTYNNCVPIDAPTTLMDNIQSILPYCLNSDLSISLVIFRNIDIISDFFNISALVSSITNSNSKTFSKIKVDINVRFIDSVYMVQFISNHLSSTSIDITSLEELGREYGKYLIKIYNKWFQPFLKIDKKTMIKTGIKLIDINIISDYRLDITDFMFFTRGEKDLEWKKIQTAFDKHIYGIFNQIIKEHCDNKCDRNVTKQSLKIQYKRDI